MKKCKNCDMPFQETRTTQSVCSPRCALELLKEKKEKKKRKEIREQKAKLKSRADYMAEAQFSFNRFIRQRDLGLPCVSCQRDHTGQWHAGHLRTTGAAPQLRVGDPADDRQRELAELNCNKQCAPCNNHLSGNLLAYRAVLVERHGEEKVQEIENYNESKKWTIEELQEIKKYYNQKYRSLL